MVIRKTIVEDMKSMRDYSHRIDLSPSERLRLFFEDRVLSREEGRRGGEEGGRRRGCGSSSANSNYSSTSASNSASRGSR